MEKLRSWLGSHPGFVAFAALAIVTAVAGGLIGTRRNIPGEQRARGFRLTLRASFFLIGIAAAVGAAWSLAGASDWGYALAVIPSLLIARHGVYLRLVRRSEVPSITVAEGSGGPPTEAMSGDSAKLRGYVVEKRNCNALLAQRARDERERQFGVTVLAVQYGIPALAIAVIVAATFTVLRADAEPAVVTAPSHRPLLGAERPLTCTVSLVST